MGLKSAWKCLIISENGRSGLSCAQASLILRKCTITKNSTGVSRQESSIYTEDCIFSNNAYGPCIILKSYTINDGLPSNNITAIHVDDQEAWIGTFDGGVAQYNFVEDKWVTTNEENGLASARVYDIVKYKDFIYVGTGDGISIWDGHVWKTKRSLGSSKLCNVIFEVHDNLLWVASRTMHGGFFSYDGENWKDNTTIWPGRPLNNISAFTYQENILWIGSTNSGMYRFDGNEWLYYTVPDGLASNFIYTITCKESVCYAGSCCGLSVFKEENWQTYNVEGGLCHPTINAIAVDENFVWLGTREGLSLYDDLKFTSFPSDIG